MPPFATVWSRIVALEGSQFSTKTGLPFTFRVDGDALVPSRTDYNLSRRNVEKAYELVPFSGPSIINDTVRGPGYVWAILHDKRVSKGDWKVPA